MATLLTGMAFASTANAATYSAADDFEAGALKSTKTPELTVKKYWSNVQGSTMSTGSEQDDNLRDSSAQPAEGVVFSLQEVTPVNGASESTMDQNNSSTYHKTGTIYYAVTNASGIAESWGTTYTPAPANNPAGATVTDITTLPAGHHFYLLHEEYSPKANEYNKAEDSIFDLPYRAVNADGTTKTDGYVYHLHVFPKNVSSNPITKQITSITENNGTQQTTMAKVGDTVNYRIVYRYDGYQRPENTPDAGFYWSDNQFNGGDVRIVDRLSASFGQPRQTETPAVKFDVNGVEHTAYVSTYATTALTQAPSTPNGFDGQPIFNDTSRVPSDARYFIWNFFDGRNVLVSGSDGNGPNVTIPTNATNIRIVLNLQADLVSTNDDDSHAEGTLVNDVAFSNGKHHQGQNTGTTASAGVQFGKSDTAGNPLKDVRFRLVNPANHQEFLCTDGQFHAPNEDGTFAAGETPVEATSNVRGVVTFVNLPIFDTETSGDHAGQAHFHAANLLSFDVIEMNAPDGYDRPNVTFGTVSFASHAGQYVSQRQDGTAFTPDDPQLNFNEWSAATKITDPAAVGRLANFTDINNKKIPTTKILVNWKHGEPGKPIHLPLTGGQGIVLLLVLGAAIMAIVLVERKRRQAQARR